MEFLYYERQRENYSNTTNDNTSVTSVMGCITALTQEMVGGSFQKITSNTIICNKSRGGSASLVQSCIATSLNKRQKQKTQKIITQVQRGFFKCSLLLITQFVTFTKTKIKHVIFSQHIYTNPTFCHSWRKRQLQLWVDKYWGYYGFKMCTLLIIYFPLWGQSLFGDCSLQLNYSQVAQYNNFHLSIPSSTNISNVINRI